MGTPATLEEDVVDVLDIQSPLALRNLPPAERASTQLNMSNGFDKAAKIVLAVTLGNIAARYGNGHARLIRSSESLALGTVADAVDLTARAAAGQP